MASPTAILNYWEGTLLTELEKKIKAKIPGEDTGIQVKRSLCAICSPGHHCGVDCYVKDGKIIRVEGTMEHPYTLPATFLAISRQGLFLDIMLLILPPLMGLLGIQMAQSLADLCSLVCAVLIQRRTLKRLQRLH